MVRIVMERAVITYVARNDFELVVFIELVGLQSRDAFAGPEGFSVQSEMLEVVAA